jgi:hypothetical protein
MNNLTLPFNFDYAVAVFELVLNSKILRNFNFKFYFKSFDIWGTSGINDAARSAVIGYSTVGGICSLNKYSIVEYLGFNDVYNAVHELGHK